MDKLKQNALVSQRPADFIPFECNKWTPEMVHDPMLYYKASEVEVIYDP